VFPLLPQETSTAAKSAKTAAAAHRLGIRLGPSASVRTSLRMLCETRTGLLLQGMKATQQLLLHQYPPYQPVLQGVSAASHTRLLNVRQASR